MVCAAHVEMLSLADFEARAKTFLSRVAWQYYAKGGKVTLKDNSEAFSRYDCVSQ